MARHADVEHPKHIALFVRYFKGSGVAQRALLNLACPRTYPRSSKILARRAIFFMLLPKTHCMRQLQAP